MSVRYDLLNKVSLGKVYYSNLKFFKVRNNFFYKKLKAQIRLKRSTFKCSRKGSEVANS